MNRYGKFIWGGVRVICVLTIAVAVLVIVILGIFDLRLVSFFCLANERNIWSKIAGAGAIFYVF